MKYESMSDLEILQLIRKDDHQAMDYLLNKYRGMVRKETRKVFLMGADEEDLTQEGMIGLFKAIRDYDDTKDTDFALFAHVCIVRQLLSAVTASNRQKHIPMNTYISLYAPVEKDESTLALQEILEGNEYNPEQQLLAQEGVDEIWQDIDTLLSPMEKKVLDYYLEGYSYEKIGEALSKSKKSINNAIQRIRNKLSVKR